MMIPKKRFALLVREICEEIMRENFGFRAKGLRWEADALTSLQMMTEHVLVMFMEMRSPYFDI
jgi:histone H3/H4